MENNKLSQEEVKQKVISLRKKGTPKRVIPTLLQIGPKTVDNILKEAGMNENLERLAPVYLPPREGGN